MIPITLRDVTESDLPVFFEQQLDPDAIHMAAFTAKDPTDRAAFMAHWARITSSEKITVRTVLADGQVTGSISCFEMFGELNVSYWLGREFWGKGIATDALRQFLDVVTTRPLYGRAAKDNLGSIRVLQKCGFVLISEATGFANARGQEIAEVVLRRND